ncbi:MAG: methyltransferase [Bacteroidales bacterium]|nr:methyltransferase [Bacteroidales bacterium]MDY0349294.1 methyltransferase [Tenuifilaceae bacterium]
MQLTYPEPILDNKDFISFLASTPNRKAFEGLRRGENYFVEGTYGTAMAFYSWVKKQINQLCPITDYQSSRANRSMLRELSKRFFVRIVNSKVDLANAPSIPWLAEFYPSLTEFYLPFTDILGINGAWQWYSNGVSFPNLQHQVHPYYGAYFPTRTEHLKLFDGWLKRSKPIKNAMDLGTGCGVLSFYMLKHGVANVLATDINPNALHSVNLDLQRQGNTPQVKLQQTDLFCNVDTSKLDLVVCNPPWIPDRVAGSNDMAMYHDDDFFERFFRSAHDALPKGCKLVILFSTFAQAAGLSVEHPIAREITSNNRFTLVNRTQIPVKQKPSKRKSWLSDIRKDERVELWELGR